MPQAVACTHVYAVAHLMVKAANFEVERPREHDTGRRDVVHSTNRAVKERQVLAAVHIVVDRQVPLGVIYQRACLGHLVFLPHEEGPYNASPGVLLEG